MYARGSKQALFASEIRAGIMFASEATCTPVVASVVKIRAGIMFASEATCTPVVNKSKRC